MKLLNSVCTTIVMAATLSTFSLPFSITAAIADSPAMNITEYELNSHKVEECVNTAKAVMKEEDFKEINVSARDVFGATGDISIEMYCVRDGKTLILVIAGSKPEDLQKIQKALDKRLSQ